MQIKININKNKKTLKRKIPQIKQQKFEITEFSTEIQLQNCHSSTKTCLFSPKKKIVEITRININFKNTFLFYANNFVSKTRVGKMRSRKEKKMHKKYLIAEIVERETTVVRQLRSTLSAIMPASPDQKIQKNKYLLFIIYVNK